jgi:hypothetical protein
MSEEMQSTDVSQVNCVIVGVVIYEHGTGRQLGSNLQKGMISYVHLAVLGRRPFAAAF